MSQTNNDNTRAFLRNLIQSLYRLAEQPQSHDKPGSIRLKLAGGVSELPVIGHPEPIAQIARQPEIFIKNYNNINMLGISRFNANGEQWRLRSALTQKQYMDAGRSDRLQHIRQQYEAALGSCANAASGRLPYLFLNASIGVFHEALGATLNEPDRLIILFDRIRNLLLRLQFYSWIPMQSGVQAALHSEAEDLLEAIDGYMLDEPGLQRLRQQFNDEMQAQPSFRANEEYLMNLFAGIETTVSTLLWITCQLAAYPEAQANIREALKNDPTPAILDGFISETLRFYPPVPFVVRELARDFNVGGVTLRSGQIILVSIIGAHRHPDYWSRPCQFDPHRSEFMHNSYDKNAFIPFFQGSRMCGGARLARQELREGTRALLLNYTISNNHDHADIDYGLAMRPVDSALPEIRNLERSGIQLSN
ncbi:hypothetical protein J2T55_002571 [Methylohalomonas lacus]|uniref:Cytochrome P450 n=1 Tax=Methylohalomonas lacus TaxID=398773 RepID=A0AAE3HPA0_9GAMM|nr:cytochrome P450 [Methylohalomonas lacus]MCS3904532.1 hypothetical protein [Methylohalomonas lacus]